MSPLPSRLSIALLAGVLAGLTRATLPDVKTRLQLLVALTLAALFEWLVRHRLGQRPSVIGFVLNATAIIVAMTVVKIAIDGRPHYPAWLRHLGATIGIPL